MDVHLRRGRVQLREVAKSHRASCGLSPAQAPEAANQRLLRDQQQLKEPRPDTVSCSDARFFRSLLEPHRLDRYLSSNDPQFEQKAAEIIGLYLNPPQHAAIFCVDEKSAIQALDRLDRRLPLSPGRAERHGFEYYRHGTLSLYAALNPQTGEVMGQTAARHTSKDFVAFLSGVVATQPADRVFPIILDNLSAHKTPLGTEFLAQHPNVKFHFTPTYSSWLNQVEMWFSKLQPDVITRGIFPSLADLQRKLLRYLRLYSKSAKPFKWKYNDIRNRIASR